MWNEIRIRMHLDCVWGRKGSCSSLFVMEFVINFDILQVHWQAVWSHSHSVCAGTVWLCASSCAPSVSCPNYRCLCSFTIEWKQLRSHLRRCVTTMLMSPSPLLHCVVCEQATYWCSLFFSANYATLPCPRVFATRVISQTLESTQMGGVSDIGAKIIPKELLVIMSAADVCVGMSV